MLGSEARVGFLLRPVLGLKLASAERSGVKQNDKEIVIDTAYKGGR